MENDSLWYKTAVIYELHVRSFYDSNADGIGDFRGLREKLGYFEDLGVTALWLLPFYPSPLRDDGYDISDYCSIHPSYGTLEDFRDFLDEAHRRNLRVITELVLNHTSDQHPWFQRSRLAPPGSIERDFYIWSDTPQRYEEARVIFGDFETSNWAWDPVAKAYYWHRFYSHQPDLNFDNLEVQRVILDTLDFWLDIGVDGLRLDAVPYLFAREGTSCENLPETHAYLRKLRQYMDEKFPGRMLLAEANQWPEDAAAYFGEGNECHMEFHFPLMPRLFMSLQMEDCFPLIDILEQTPPIPENCQWAIFLRNHDELTLEMVSDEERDYMVRLYAADVRARINLGIRRRLAPLLDNNRRKIELMTSLLLSLPGTPILYYGDEIGMGDNFYLGDRNGVRTPMQWSADRNAGFSRANPQQLFLPIIIDPEFHYETVNVDVKKANLSSIFWSTRRMLAIRQKYPTFAHGDIRFLPTENSKVLAYLRRHQDQVLLVIANLSRFSQAVALDLSEFFEWHPIELFGNTQFPIITHAPYLFTLGPHGFYWLHLHQALEPGGSQLDHHLCLLTEEPKWTPQLEHKLEVQVLPRYIRECRWFGEKQRTFRELKIVANFAPNETSQMRILLVEVAFAQGRPATYVLPVCIGEKGNINGSPHAAIAQFSNGEILWDGLFIEEMRQQLLTLILEGKTWVSGISGLFGIPHTALPAEIPISRVLGGEQSNSSILFGDQLNLKLLRHYEPGPHPDTDILRVLEEQNFPHVPRYCGEIRYAKDGRQGTIALLTSYVPNQGDAWTHTLDVLAMYFESALTTSIEKGKKIFSELTANYPERARQLGLRTGELHHCLGKLSGKEYAAEPFTSFYQRSLYQTQRSLARRTELELIRKIPSLPEDLQKDAKDWIARGPALLAFYSKLLNKKIFAKKIRIHGDYHLGQVLNTGKDFVILDFEGEPRRSLGERLLKRAPLVDVAGMLRSFDYAIQAALSQQRPEDHTRLAPWRDLWKEAVISEFLEGYLTGIEDKTLLPQDPEDFIFLLNVFLLDKAIYEISYELHYRPDLLRTPLHAALHLLQTLDDNKLVARIFAKFSNTSTTV